MVERFGGSNHDEIDWDREAAAQTNAAEMQERQGRERDQFKEQVDDLQLQNTDLQQQAQTDALTGLFNRRGFMGNVEAIFQGIQERQHIGDTPLKQAAIIAIDVDNFKSVNDTYGHDAGDQVLRALGALLEKSFRGDDVVGRLKAIAEASSAGRVGGEEFLACMVNASKGDALRKAERLRTEFGAIAFDFGQGPVRFTISLGVASTDDASDTKEVITKADEALYAAKRAGRNRSVVSGVEAKAA